MESIHFRHPGGTPEDEADALKAPRARDASHLAAKVAAALGEPHAPASPPAQLISRTAAAAAAGAAAGAVLATREQQGPRTPAAATPARLLQRRGLSLQVAALCAVAAAAAQFLHVGSVQEPAGTWLLQTTFFLWIAHRETPMHATAWVVATCFFGAALAGRCAAARDGRETSQALTPLASAYLVRVTLQAGGDAQLFWNGPQAVRGESNTQSGK